jgi:hypothetical protein
MKEPTSDFAHLWNDLPNKILEIAKSLKDKDLYFGCYLYWDKQSEKNVTIQAYKWGSGGRMFNPYKNDADAFKVLEALVKKCFALGVQFDFIESDQYQYAICLIDNSGVRNFWGNNLNDQVSNAYLSLIQQDEG